ncbi:DUF309 domain-containing protein [Paenibacillus arenilitoris]|uniref:DUF309 domain-containing protein n=1 Tax=Paenibacillus arenilitoris TaxID=2772299 RepID=A0A927H6C9_9BACL|nr:DUF309 domain-containing protein [Paenibacillus arenilitoris]MBD2869855.1 DUF309 domain-containing protein [Paenibacillus arenilitoris]
MTNFPNAYVSYLTEFHASRDFFECHELLEEYWKEHPGDALAEAWVGLIQLAVALYHQRRGNFRGALMMFGQAERKLSADALDRLCIERESLQAELAERIEALKGGEPLVYADMNLRITSDRLSALCLAQCEERGWTWGAPSPMKDDSIVHRHKLRDRTDVIAARREAYDAKIKERGGSS